MSSSLSGNTLSTTNGNMTLTTTATWTQQTSAPPENWNSICCSSSGQFLAACVNSGGIYTSNDSGSTWILRSSAPQHIWSSICSDSKGQFLAACVNGGGIYTSNDSGSTWILRPSAPQNNWSSICSDSTGQFLAACVNSGGIYTSNDSGSTWILRSSAPQHIWSSICSDSTGQFLAACVYGGGIYTSNDSGSTWILRPSAPQNNWYSICSDSTGQYLVACVYGGNIYTNSNFGGGTWSQTSAPSKNWISICSSSSGQYLTACVNGGNIYTSNNFGGTWGATTAPSKNWRSVCCSSSGDFLVACATGANIYTYKPPSISIIASETIALNSENILLSNTELYGTISGDKERRDGFIDFNFYAPRGNLTLNSYESITINSDYYNLTSNNQPISSIVGFGNNKDGVFLEIIQDMSYNVFINNLPNNTNINSKPDLTINALGNIVLNPNVNNSPNVTGSVNTTYVAPWSSTGSGIINQRALANLIQSGKKLIGDIGGGNGNFPRVSGYIPFTTEFKNNPFVTISVYIPLQNIEEQEHKAPPNTSIICYITEINIGGFEYYIYQVGSVGPIAGTPAFNNVSISWIAIAT
jgi:hypothetical protein